METWRGREIKGEGDKAQKTEK
ncbi:uncharacterized protein G2W53_020625 [Senna tora]|uniref:Uncharacterized protein n=1 Tax=Senna tora TaxID=362788 RepID=A0A834TJW7_9FABA|nr:uncharacterized protein G2W53_020625 [Senna tora]